MTTVLITGGRDYSDTAQVENVLGATLQRFPELVVVQGGAKGADTLARLWCARNGVPCITMDAQWDYYGKAAGGIRNGWMLEFMKPNFLIAFPGGRGTADMIKKANAKGVLVYEA